MGAHDQIVYMLVSPLGGVPFYVGIGRIKRPHDHFYETANRRLRNRKVLLLRGLIAAGYRYAEIVKVIATGLTKAEAANTEEWLVRSWGRRSYHTGPLLNRTWGGETTPSQEPEQRAASSARMRERYSNPDERAASGKRMRAAWARDPERKQQLASDTTERWANPEKRKAHSAALAATAKTPATKAKRSESQLAAWAHPEAVHRRAAMASAEARAALREAQARPESRARHHATHSTPEYRAKLSAAKAAFWSVPGRREELAERNRRDWSDPATHAKRIESMNEPDALERRKSAAANCWQRPEYRERQRAAQKAALARQKRQKSG